MKFISSFLTLYEEASISAASARLYITQQGLSKQIQMLENELGIVLFERSKHGVLHTPICETLYPVFLRMYNEYEKALSLIEENKKEQKKCISIAFAQGISNGGSAEFIFQYQKLHPEITIEILELNQSVCIQKLIDKEMDMAFLVNPFDQTKFNTTLLSEGYMYAAMHKSHPFAASNEPLDFVHLNSQCIITGSPQNALRNLFDHYCKLSGILPNIIVSSNYSLNYVNAMTDNTGIATVTAKMANQIVNEDIRLRRLLTPEPGCIYCCTPHKGKNEQEARSLLAYVTRHFELEELRW